MAPSTTGSPGPAPAGNGMNNQQLGQRRPVKGAPTQKKPHVVPVLPLPLTKPRPRNAQTTTIPSSSPTAGDHNAKSPTSAAPVRSTSPPSAVEVGLPNIDALVITPNNTNGANSPAPKSHAVPNGSGLEQNKQQATADATVGVEPDPNPRTTTITNTTTREPLAAYRSTNAIPPPSLLSPTALNGFAPPHPPRGKENIPPTANGFAMAQQPPAFGAPRNPMHHPQLSLSDSSMMGAHTDSNNNNNNTSPVPPETGRYRRPAHLNLPPFPTYPPPTGSMVGHVSPFVPGIPHYPAHGDYHVLPANAHGMAVAPSTPHSFHGSQASNPPDGATGFEENGYHHRPQPPMTANGARAVYGSVNHPGFPPAPGSAAVSAFFNTRSLELARMLQREAREYIELNFNNRDTSDCQLIVTFLGDSEGRPWRAPIFLHGHRLVLGFSPALRAHLHGHPNSGGTLGMASDDRYLRNDVLWICLGSLYGRPIPERPESDPFMAAAYIAAGHFLQLGAIAMKGAEDIVRLMNTWVQLEMACAIALGGAVHQFPGSDPTQSASDVLLPYGPASERILVAIASFIIDNFPHNYVVDPKYPYPRYARIPAYDDVYKGDKEAMTAPSVDEATGIPIRHEGLRYSNPLLSQIKFGDVPLPNNGPDAAAAPQAQCPKPKKTATLADRLAACEPNPNRLLTSVLANLPFGVLKNILESNMLGKGPGQPVTGWPTMKARCKIMSQVVAERERRRIDAINAVLANAAADPSVKRRLASPYPPRGGPADGWDVLGWREEVAGSDQAPQLVRAWAPLPPSTP